MISAQPFCFLPVVVLSHPSVLPRRSGSDSPRRINQTGARRRGRRRPTRKSLEWMNLLYLLLCYAIIETDDGAGQKEMMVFTQHRRPALRVRAAQKETSQRPDQTCLLASAGPSAVSSIFPTASCFRGVSRSGFMRVVQQVILHHTGSYEENEKVVTAGGLEHSASVLTQVRAPLVSESVNRWGGDHSICHLFKRLVHLTRTSRCEI